MCDAVQVRALHAYEATAGDELTFAVGGMILDLLLMSASTRSQPHSLTIADIIDNVIEMDGGWWEGDLNGKHGVFPGPTGTGVHLA